MADRKLKGASFAKNEKEKAVPGRPQHVSWMGVWEVQRDPQLVEERRLRQAGGKEVEAFKKKKQAEAHRSKKRTNYDDPRHMQQGSREQHHDQYQNDVKVAPARARRRHGLEEEADIESHRPPHAVRSTRATLEQPARDDSRRVSEVHPGAFPVAGPDMDHSSATLGEDTTTSAEVDEEAAASPEEAILFSAELVDEHEQEEIRRNVERLSQEVQALQQVQREAPIALVVSDEENDKEERMQPMGCCRKPSRRRWMIVVAAAVLILLAVIVGIVVWQTVIKNGDTEAAATIEPMVTSSPSPTTPEPSSSTTPPPTSPPITWSQLGSELIGNILESPRFGRSVAYFGSEFAVGSSGINNAGRVQTFGTLPDYVQGDFVGDADDDDLGASIAFAGIGIGYRRVAVGAPGGNYVKIFHPMHYDTASGPVNAWSFSGIRLDAPSNNSSSRYFGGAVALSYTNATVLAVGDLLHSGANGDSSGQVMVYDKKNYDWSPLGQALNGDAALDSFGSSVALSSDGKILAVGASQLGFARQAVVEGYVRVFRLESGNWNRHGQDLTDGIGWNGFGISVALSSDGLVLAVGAIGKVSVFQWNDSEKNWIQLGLNITDDDGDFGKAIDLSGDGLTLAAGAPTVTDDDGDFGKAIDLSGDGLSLAVGAPKHASEKGLVRIFHFDGTDWNQQGGDLLGDTAGDHFGSAVALSFDGDRLVVGAPDGIVPYIIGDGKQVGYVRMYEAS